MPSTYKPKLYQTDNPKIVVMQMQRELRELKKVVDDLTDRVVALEGNS